MTLTYRALQDLINTFNDSIKDMEVRIAVPDKTGSKVYFFTVDKIQDCWVEMNSTNTLIPKVAIHCNIKDMLCLSYIDNGLKTVKEELENYADRKLGFTREKFQ